MAESNQPTPNIGGNGFVWLLLAAAGTFFVTHQVPLEGSRPPTTDKFISEQVDVQDIDARLWQDPFAAVADTLARSPDLKPDKCQKNEIKHHCRSPLEKSEPPYPLVLIASVSAAPYSDDQEFRRRTRYAVLAGLAAEGLVPKDPQHIGFYWPDPAGQDHVQMPKVVPFEWFKPKSKSNGASLPDTLLLWYDEDVLRDVPLKQFDAFLCRSLATVAPDLSVPWAKVKILGPQNSATLQAMAVEDGEHWSKGACPKSARPQFYVYSATADDAFLIPKDDAPKYLAMGSSCLTSGLSDFFDDKKHVNLHRMIAADDALARTIRNELSLRGVDNEVEQNRHSHIALVSEWDTLYGRSLPESMARCLGEREESNKPEKPWLHRFKYLRGLDGQMPNVDGLGSGNGSKDTGSKPDKDSKDSSKSGPDAKPHDRAEGQGQFDYLRRLGDSMQQLDTELRRESKGIEAIGILGSDLYDKLLVLQALRPLFPNALFFTTDLDALVLNPVAQTSTRNLLIASGFGLELRPAIQGEIPPFRSSYQTAGFLATRVAIRSDDTKHGRVLPWSKPLLFEVGRSGGFRFASQDEQPKTEDRLEDKLTENKNCEDDLLKCATIHPDAPAMFPQVSLGPALALAIAFCGLGLGVVLSCRPLRRRLWDPIDAFLRNSKSYAALCTRGAAVLTGFCIVIAALLGGIYKLWPALADCLTRGGQPMALLDGISVWPTIFLRAATLILCVLLLVHGYWWLIGNMEKIVQDLHLAGARQGPKTEQDHIVRGSAPYTRFVSHFWYRIPGYDKAIRRKGKLSAHDIRRFWQFYIYQGYWIARTYRVAAWLSAMAVLWFVLHLMVGSPAPPVRGSVSFWAYQIVTPLLVVATLILIFFVADTTLLCWQVIKTLREETNVWPAKSLEEYSTRIGLPEGVLDDWIDLLFVSKRTKCITSLIYSPFLIIALLVVSRSRLFANYGANLAELITMGVGVLIVTGCAVALRSSAEASRAKARRRLNDQIVAARKLKDSGRLASQLETLLHRVEELRDGAFSPFSQQPVVRAMLLPLGSFGGTALLEYLLLPGLS